MTDRLPVVDPLDYVATEIAREAKSPRWHTLFKPSRVGRTLRWMATKREAKLSELRNAYSAAGGSEQPRQQKDLTHLRIYLTNVYNPALATKWTHELIRELPYYEGCRAIGCVIARDHSLARRHGEVWWIGHTLAHYAAVLRTDMREISKNTTVHMKLLSEWEKRCCREDLWPEELEEARTMYEALK